MTAKKNLPYAMKIVTHGFRLPKYIRYLENKVAEYDASIKSLRHEASMHSAHIKALQEVVDSYNNLDDRLTDLQNKISIAPQSIQKTHINRLTENTINNTVADNHSYDLFYKKFEDKFRGTEKLIQERVSEHLPLFKSLSPTLKKKPIVDIGCGRGEFLTVLKEAGFEAIGVDMNKDMVKRANDIGLEAVQDDARSYLSKLSSGNLAAIAGFHIVEHIPFESLMDIFTECYRTLARGGFVLFETPNPRSLNVGANTFYTDPSHIRPVPSELLSFMLEYIGFKVKVVPLHRSVPELNSDSYGLNQVHETVFGYSDYAVVGKK